MRSPSSIPSEYQGEINPDGIPISVVWAALTVGASVFIPALNIPKLIKQMNQAARKRGIKLKAVERIEAGKLGARFWRLL